MHGKTKEQNAWSNRNSRMFPADQLGIPLSIYVPGSYRDDGGRLDSAKHTLDKHHRFAPRKRLLHKEGELGKVLRYSCLQIVPKELHASFNRRYTKPQLPEERSARFGVLLLSVARYIPAEAIDVSGDEPVSRELELHERQLLWENNEVRPEQGPRVQREILNYVVNQNINGVDEGAVEQFLTTQSQEIRTGIGKKLFRIAAEVAVEPIAQEYIDAWGGGLLPRQDIRQQERLHDLVQGRAVPKSPGKFITRHVVRNVYDLRYSVDQLYDNLATRYAA